MKESLSLSSCHRNHGFSLNPRLNPHLTGPPGSPEVVKGSPKWVAMGFPAAAAHATDPLIPVGCLIAVEAAAAMLKIESTTRSYVSGLSGRDLVEKRVGGQPD